MAEEILFKGFPKKGITFLKKLSENNSKVWFEEHKKEYETSLVDPARAFVVALGERLRKTYPQVVADPRVNKSLFRINRDTRFSKDKTPYKTHLALLFWDDHQKRMEGPGFYFHLEPGRLMIAGGQHRFTKDLLEPYRQAVVNDGQGKKLVKIVKDLNASGTFTVGGEHYKTVPRGYDKEHPRAELLKYKGLFAGWEGKVPKEAHSEKLVEFTAEKLLALKPLHRWLVALK